MRNLILYDQVYIFQLIDAGLLVILTNLYEVESETSMKDIR